MTETEQFLKYKFESLAKQDFGSIPLLEIKLVSDELTRYVESRHSPREGKEDVVTNPIPQLFDAENVDGINVATALSGASHLPGNEGSLGKVLVNRSAKAAYFRSPERKVLHAFLCDNVRRFGQVIDISPEILGLTHFDKRAFVSACTHVSGGIYEATFPNARLSYRRVDGMEGTHFIITVLTN